MRLETEAYPSDFGILVKGDVFTVEKCKDEPFMVVSPVFAHSDSYESNDDDYDGNGKSEDNYVNAVSLKTGILTYFSDRDVVEYYPNARVAL